MSCTINLDLLIAINRPTSIKKRLGNSSNNTFAQRTVIITERKEVFYWKGDKSNTIDILDYQEYNNRVEEHYWRRFIYMS